MKALRPLIKLNGEKYSIREWILDEFPENYHDYTYIEPFGGAANILFCKDKSKTEIINDQSAEITNILRALRDEPDEVVKRLNGFKTLQEHFVKAEKRKSFEDYLDHAVNDLFLRKITKNGNKKQFLKPSNALSWKNNIKSLKEYAARMHGVYVFSKPALEIISAFNFEDTLLFCDPPYLTDNKLSKVVYSSEMPPEDHIELSRVLNDFNGKVMLMGVMSPLYKRLYKNWNISKKRIDNGKEKRTEIIWKNF